MSPMCIRLLLTVSFIVLFPIPSTSKDFLFRQVVDPDTKVRLSLPSNRSDVECNLGPWGQIYVIGELPQPINLLDDELMRTVLNKGRDHALTECGNERFLKEIRVNLYASKFAGFSSSKASVTGSYDRSDRYSTLKSYINREAKEREKEERQREQEQSRRERIAAAAKQLGAVLEKYGAKGVVPCSSLATNPFAFEGEVVAVSLVFDSMLERDKGLFGTGEMSDCRVVASGIPPRTFATQQVYVLVAGRVMGKTEVKLPLGPPSLPHLKFVGVHFCQEARCAEFAPR